MFFDASPALPGPRSSTARKTYNLPVSISNTLFQHNMSPKKTHLIFSLLGGLFLLCFDQLLKFIARANPAATYYLWKPWLGWEYFPNLGIAFGLPIPYYLVITATPIILVIILGFFHKITTASLRATLGAAFITSGAISNFIDRYLFSVTIDYIRIAASVINLADIMIVGGALLCFLEVERAKLSPEKN